MSSRIFSTLWPSPTNLFRYWCFAIWGQNSGFSHNAKWPRKAHSICIVNSCWRIRHRWEVLPCTFGFVVIKLMHITSMYILDIIWNPWCWTSNFFALYLVVYEHHGKKDTLKEFITIGILEEYFPMRKSGFGH